MNRVEYLEKMIGKLHISYVLILFVVLLILAGSVWILRKIRRRKPLDIDSMEGHDFEYFCAGLLEKNGFQDVEVTRASGDYGIDILAAKEGVTYAIQCKRYSEQVGIKAVQEAYAGRDYYDCMVGVVLTNQYFTKSAETFAGKLKILLWDRDFLESLMEGTEI